MSKTKMSIEEAVRRVIVAIQADDSLLDRVYEGGAVRFTAGDLSGPANVLAACCLEELKSRAELAEQIDKLLDTIEYLPQIDEKELAITNKHFGADGVFAEGWGLAVFDLRPKLRALLLGKNWENCSSASAASPQ